MDLYLLFILPILGIISGGFVKLIPEIIARMLLITIEIYNEKITSDLDSYILFKNPDNNYELTHVKKPMNNWHFVWEGSPILLIRYTDDHDKVSYTLRGFAKSITNILEKSAKFSSQDNEKGVKTKNKERKINVFYREGYHTNKFLQRLPQKALPGQQKVLDKLCEIYKKRIEEPDADFPKFSLSIMLFGPPGVGKSSVARLLAWELKARLILGCDLTDHMFTMRSIYNLSKNETTIVVFDEIDRAFEYAEYEKENIKLRSYAKNKQSLTGIFDRLEYVDNYITLATTNCTYEKINEKYPWYIRKGRFDIKITMTLNDIIIHED
jgi:hypothetical protein